MKTVSCRTSPIFSVPDTRACKIKEGMGAWMRISRKMNEVCAEGRRSVPELWFSMFILRLLCCSKDIPLELLSQGYLLGVQAMITLLNLSTPGSQPQHCHQDPGRLFSHSNTAAKHHKRQCKVNIFFFFHRIGVNWCGSEKNVTFLTSRLSYVSGALHLYSP